MKKKKKLTALGTLWPSSPSYTLTAVGTLRLCVDRTFKQVTTILDRDFHACLDKSNVFSCKKKRKRKGAADLFSQDTDW